MENGETIKVRKFNKEAYIFKYNTIITKGSEGSYISCKTPENCLGYSDTILLTSTGEAYTLLRYLPKWILKRIEKIMQELTNQHCA